MEKEQVVHLNVEELVPSKTNRLDIGKENGELKELTESIKNEGVLFPLLVRRIEKGYEIVAGHRRMHAAKQAGLKSVPCIVRVLNDAEAEKTQILENLQRKNLSALDEARAFFSLQTTMKCDVAAIAKVVDKSEKYVYRSLALLKLPPTAIKALEKGFISAAHAHQLLRVGPKQIEGAVAFAVTPGWNDERPTVRALTLYIDSRASKSLAEAPFPKDTEYATKIACTKCPYNTGNQNVLFDGAEEGRCTNSQCYTLKVNEFYRQMAKEGESKFKDLKFAGSVRQGWSDRPNVIKGWIQVDPKEKKVAALLKSDPDKFRFGIVKPGPYGGRKAVYVLLTKEENLLPKVTQNSGYKEPTPEERAHEQFVREYVNDRTHAIHQRHYKEMEEARSKAEKEAEKAWPSHKEQYMAALAKEQGGGV